MSRLLSTLAAFALLFPSLASAQLVRSTTPLQPASQIAVPDMGHGALHIARISGTDHGIEADLVVPDGGWVYGIEIGERADVPCHIALRWATIDDDDIALASNVLTLCHGQPTSRSLTSVGFNYRESYDEWVSGMAGTLLFGGPLGLNILANTAMGAFDNSVPRHPLPYLDNANNDLVALKGLKVCQRNSNDRMKGLAVRGVTLRDGGSRFNTRPIRRGGRWQEPSFERPNCNDWDDMEVCPSGQVMVGVRIEGEATGGMVNGRPRLNIEGLAPICTRLQIED